MIKETSLHPLQCHGMLLNNHRPHVRHENQSFEHCATFKVEQFQCQRLIQCVPYAALQCQIILQPPRE